MVAVGVDVPMHSMAAQRSSVVKAEPLAEFDARLTRA
jgi:hypothetical protein